MWHFLRSQLELQLPVAEVFEFFSRAENLERITPDHLGFEILTPTPIEMRRDVEIDYRIKPGIYIYRVSTENDGVEDFVGKFSVVE